MKQAFCTKLDRNGNTYKLIIDHDRRTYALENAGFFHRCDYMPIGKRERARMIQEAKANGYHEISADSPN